MNIKTKNITLNEHSIEYIEETFYFLNEFSKKEVTLKIEEERDCFKFKIFFDIDNCNCISETRAFNLRDGIFRLKNKVKKIIFSNERKLKNSVSIRTLNTETDKKKEHEFKYINLYSIDKPIGEKDAKNFVIENKINEIMFENIDKDNRLCIMKREKADFSLYITDYNIE